MPSDLDLLVARRSEIIAALSSMGTAPDYSIEGQSVSRASARKSLLDELKQINELIDVAQGPFEIVTEYR